MKQALFAMSGAVMLAGCGGGHGAREASLAGPPPAPSPAAAASVNWRTVATLADRERLRRWRSAWRDALGRARAAGAGPAIAAQGALMEPDAALADPLPPPGDYRCRVFKLGAKASGVRDFAAYPFFACRIERDGALLRFEKVTGSQRPVGRIFPDADGRPVFLGTLMLGDEKRPIGYGRDVDRDMIGFVERVGERRWRLVLPLPAFESLTDVMELVPTGA